MRGHYKSEWHRFNLKRKVAGMQPVSHDLFTQKLTDMQTKPNEEPKGTQHLKKGKHNPPATTPDPSVVNSKPDFTNTLTSSVEVQPLDQGEDSLIDKKIKETPKLTLNHSLFDHHLSPNFESNLSYMTEKYGFFFPEIEYAKDINGLVLYLGEKISIGNTCLWCDKPFSSLEAVQAHMRDKSHCKIRWDDNEQEYADFYDLETADKRFATWDDDDDDSNEDKNNNVDKNKNNQGDSQPETTRIYINDYNQLVVSNSNESEEKVIGHRALKVYYKQRTHAQHANYQLITSLIQEHKRLSALHYQSTTNADNASIQKRNKVSLQVGIAGNKQKHYRNQNPM